MENLVPTLFHEIYRKCFGVAYNTSQESTWHWLTNQHIHDFFMPMYMRDYLPGMCIILREGHQPKMFLWMIEEYAFILSRLRVNNRDGQLVLGHELLLLTHSRCCRKRGGGQGSCRAGLQPLDHLPVCSLDTLEHAVRLRDTILLERLAWAMYNNVMGPGKSPTLSGFESYSQVL